MPYLTDTQRKKSIDVLLDAAGKAQLLTDEMWEKGGHTDGEMKKWPHRIAAINAQANSAGKLLVAEAIFTRGVTLEGRVVKQIAAPGSKK